MDALHTRIDTLGLRVIHYKRLGSAYQPADMIGTDGSALIVLRHPDDRYDFTGWEPWSDRPFGGQFGGRYQSLESALAWLEWTRERAA